MISFGPLTLIPTPELSEDRGLFRVAGVVSVRRDGIEIDVIPAGFVTDGASRPWWSAMWSPVWGKAAAPAVWHDWLCDCAALPKWEIDLLFLYALRSAGVSELRAWIMYFAVRTRRLRPR